MSKLFILTLSWNKLDSLTRLKNSLLPALQDIPFHWYIRDNASVDQTYETASTWGDTITCIKHPDNNSSFSQGCNDLFRQAHPSDDDLILFLNNDVSFNDTTSIQNMINLLKGDIGVVGAKLLYTGTNKIQHCGVVFSHKNTTRLEGLPFHFRSGQTDDESSSRNRIFQAVTGACMLLRASDFRKVGGFDEKLIWSFDDIDLACSIKHKLKKRILYCGNANISHDESASLKINPINKLYMNNNIAYFRSKWRDKVIPDAMHYTINPNHNIYHGK